MISLKYIDVFASCVSRKTRDTKDNDDDDNNDDDIIESIQSRCFINNIHSNPCFSIWY